MPPPIAVELVPHSTQWARDAQREADTLKGENNRAAAFRSVEEICRLAEPIDIRVALEVIPNALSDPLRIVLPSVLYDVIVAVILGPLIVSIRDRMTDEERVPR